MAGSTGMHPHGPLLTPLPIASRPRALGLRRRLPLPLHPILVFTSTSTPPHSRLHLHTTCTRLSPRFPSTTLPCRRARAPCVCSLALVVHARSIPFQHRTLPVRAC
jgi:hypothetical protein